MKWLKFVLASIHWQSNFVGWFRNLLIPQRYPFGLWAYAVGDTPCCIFPRLRPPHHLMPFLTPRQFPPKFQLFAMAFIHSERTLGFRRNFGAHNQIVLWKRFSFYCNFNSESRYGKIYYLFTFLSFFHFISSTLSLRLSLFRKHENCSANREWYFGNFSDKRWCSSASFENVRK